MCGRLNVTDSPAVQYLMEKLGMPLYPKDDHLLQTHSYKIS